MFAQMGAAYEVLVADAGLVECLLRERDPAGAYELAKQAVDRAVGLDAVTLLPTLRRLVGTALLDLGRAWEAVAEFELALASVDQQGTHEHGFVLLALADAYDAVDDVRAKAVRVEAEAALAALGATVP
jgi:hypothetical protein